MVRRPPRRRNPAAPVATFKSSVDLVRIAAVVRDQKGRFVQDLTIRDFEVTDGGQVRPISDFRQDVAGVSVALLFDVSGSMEGMFGHAREAATHVLSWLDVSQRRSRRVPLRHAARGVDAVHERAALAPCHARGVMPFGATSLLDAIARTAERVNAREGHRRAVIVFTDGNDNASRMTPSQVSGDRERHRRARLHRR